MADGKDPKALEQIMRITIEPGNIEVNEAMEECITDYIKETISKFGSVKHGDSVAMRTSTLKVKEGDQVIKLYVTVSTIKDKGMIRAYTFKFEKPVSSAK